MEMVTLTTGNDRGFRRSMIQAGEVVPAEPAIVTPFNNPA